MTYGLTDIHQHLLWGLDDGAKTAEDTLRMLRDAQAQGVGQVAATCHVRPGLEPFDRALYEQRLYETRGMCLAQAIPVEVLPGAEVAWTYQTVAALRQGRVPTLGGTDMVLLELWPDISLHEARDAVRQMIGAGYLPVLAHVERYRCFRWSPEHALRFRAETGALFQMNASTLLTPHGMMEKRFLRRMLREQALDAVATDAHGTPGRPVNLRQAYEWLLAHTDADYACRLTTFSGELA